MPINRKRHSVMIWKIYDVSFYFNLIYCPMFIFQSCHQKNLTGEVFFPPNVLKEKINMVGRISKYSKRLIKKESYFFNCKLFIYFLY